MLRVFRRLPLSASASAQIFVLCATVGTAGAQRQDPTYEEQRVMQHVTATGLRIDPAPEGKRVRTVTLVRREVFEPDDLLVPVVLPKFASTWPNFFHALTEESTIRRELLVREGEPYSTTLAEESMRNLRALGILALVRMVPIATDVPEQVDVLVYTRDLWSLRAEQEFSGAGEDFSLAAQLIERNFLGRDIALAGRFSLAPDLYTIGQTFTDPRLFGQDLSLSESFDLIINRETGSPEGSTGGLYFGRPFYTIAQRFSFDLNFAYSDLIARDLRNGELVGFDAMPGPTFGDVCALGRPDCIPLVWDESRFRLDASAHYRTGTVYKQTFSLGFGFFERSAAANEETRLRASQGRVFEDQVLPRSRRDVYPFVRYRLSLPRYATFTNLATFGQSENVHVGPRLDASISLPLEAFGSTYSGLSVHGALAYVWAGSDTLVDFASEGWSRLEGPNVRDQRLFLQLRAASPSFDWLWGRLVFRGYWEPRRYDSQRTVVALGGSNGLRGFPAQWLFGRGASRMLFNFEYRTRPWLLQSIHFGLVGFYDAGSVYRSVASLEMRHSVGAGLRVLFPQFNRYVFRLDVGQPIGEPGFSVLLRYGSDQVSYGSDQVVALTPGEDLAATRGLGPSLR